MQCLLLTLFVDSPAQLPQYAEGEIIVKQRSAKKNSPFKSPNFSAGSPSLIALNKQFGVLKATPIQTRANAAPELAGVYLLTLAKKTNIHEAVIVYGADPQIEYAQPNYVHRLHGTPNDSLLNRQLSLQTIRAVQAWKIQQASPDIVVGVIDTGIDYEHEDLKAAIWINAAEDLNGNEQLDDADINNIDDDGNGFIDDVIGWDFTDAPAFPDGGDFQKPDNDPFDENGHGTAVAGIIGASGNNKIGIAGLAYGCRIMTLRAGTSLGFLEEDDVASAILYAIDNGAQIINMSFGDEVASPLLRDIMAYAHAHNVVMVASSGNSATDKIHYPSGFSTTISVGASNAQDLLASFSNYGSSLDLVAPGVNILTTNTSNRYDIFSGTSASAPFVSALAALLLSRTPELSNKAVKGLLLSTTDDLGPLGWDIFFAGGRINAELALQSPYFSVAQITSPEVDQGFAQGKVMIRGTAVGTFLESYRLDIGAGETPEAWTKLFKEAKRQRIDRAFFELKTDELNDGIYTLRLVVTNKNGTAIEDKVRIFVDRTPPEILNTLQTDLVDGALPSVLIEFETDELCDATIFYRQAGSRDQFSTKALRFRTTSHRVNFSQNIFHGKMEFFIEATNSAGLSSNEDNHGAFFTADLSAPAIGGKPVDRLAHNFPPAFLLNKTADFDQDGNLEIIVNEYDERFNFTGMKILESSNGQFEERFSTQPEIYIPRDWGDSDGDGKQEILAGNGATTYIFEASATDQFPTIVAWQNSDDAWASRFADLDQDGMGEIILRHHDIFTVWENIGDNQYSKIDSFPNPTPGSNFVGVPHSEIADFDGDGRLEILLGDYDGDIYIYENIGDNAFATTWSDRMPLLDAIDYLATGDFDGDGVADFLAGSHSDPNLNFESNFDSRHWIFRIYKSIGDNVFEPVWQQGFFGFQSPADFDSGVSTGDVDNDGRDEIMLSLFPDFYIIDFNRGSTDYEIIWHKAPARSNASVIADFNSDGVNEFLINTGNAVSTYRLLTEFTGPATPTNFTAKPEDANEVRLSWQHKDAADQYRIYRGTQAGDLAHLNLVTKKHYQDKDVIRDSTYFYAVTTIDSSLSPQESKPTPTLQVTPGAKPYLLGAIAETTQQIRLLFSKMMNSSLQDQRNYFIVGAGVSVSAVTHKSGREVVITSPGVLPTGAHTVVVKNVFDLAGTPIDTTRNKSTFEILIEPPAPYLVLAERTTPTTLRLTFSKPIEPASAAQTTNFKVEPDIEIIAAAADAQDAKIILLQLSPLSPIGPFGKEYFVRVQNIISRDGKEIEFGEGDTAALIFSSPDLSHVFAYPNPYHSDSGAGFVTIAGLTNNATVRILNINGRVIRTLEETDGNGGVQWNLLDKTGREVASGIYLFYVVSGDKKTTGKFAVVR